MHPEIEQDHAGHCPKCGMTLEPKTIGAGDEEEQKEIRSLSRKFWSALVLTIPVLFIATGHAIPGLDVDAMIPKQISKWIEFALATPVVLWAGDFFFTRAWRSIVNRSLNMFTLIAVGVGAAYFYSAVAVLAPGIFPESFRSNGEVGLYFEACRENRFGNAAVANCPNGGGRATHPRTYSETRRRSFRLFCPGGHRHRGDHVCYLVDRWACAGDGLRFGKRRLRADYRVSMRARACHAHVDHGWRRTCCANGNPDKKRGSH